MNVSTDVKNAYKNNTASKVINISFPDLNYVVPTDEVYYESMSLEEAIFDDSSFQAVGCIASQFEIEIRDTGEELKGTRIVVTISLKGIADSTIPLFYGYVDSVEREAQKKMQKIVAYDALYSIGNTDVASWYNNLNFPITLYNFRSSLFSYLQITEDDTALPNDSIIIQKEYTPNTMKAINVIKALCQINGCFGKINRTGTFEYRFLDTEATPEDVAYYKSIDYKDYVVKPVDKLTIRQNTDDSGVTVGSGENQYIIQGNMFTYNLSSQTILTMASNILTYLEDIQYIPFEATNNGYPWIEVGDNCTLKYQVHNFYSTSESDKHIPVTVVTMHRVMKGIQNLTDEYSAEGQELQREFVSDISSELDALKQTVENLQRNMSTEITVYRNVDAITITDGNTVDIADLTYSADEGNTVLFHEEVSMEVAATESSYNSIYTENDVLATVHYYVNGYRLINHVSEGLIREGKHLLSLMQFWEAGEAETNRVQAKLTVTGGSVVIPKLHAQAYITVKQSEFNRFGIKVAHEPNKVVYALDDLLDYTGLVIRKDYYDDSSYSPDITSKCEFSPKEWTKVTSTEPIEVIVTYIERNEIGELKVYNTQFMVSTSYLIGISVENTPLKDEYFLGESLSLIGTKVMADYVDGDSVDVTSQCTFNPPAGYQFISKSEGEIGVTYTEHGITKTTEMSVTVMEVEITQLKVTAPPTKRAYKVGETLDYTGMIVRAFYNNGTDTEVTSSCTFDPADGSTVTDETGSVVTITYGEQTATFDGLEIATVEGIEVIPPSQTSYEIGETMDYSGLAVNLKWSDGSTEDITSSCTITPPDGTTADMNISAIRVVYSSGGQVYEDESATLDIYEFTGIEVTTEPTTTEYWLGDETDYSGIVVTGNFSNDTTIDVTNECTFNPASDTPTTMSMSEVDISYTRNGQVYHTPFTTQISIVVKEPEPVLKYLNYTIDTGNRKIFITGLNAEEIANDKLRNLEIPATYTDPDSGITFTMVLSGN